MVHVFIVNPIVCEDDMAQKLRERLSRIPGLNYYVLTTREAGHERELVEMLCHFFDSETIRFYSVGGSGTLYHVLNGLPELSRVELACIPYGTCDFLRNFTENLDLFRNIESMIEGEVVYVDYIKTNLGRSLNTVSFGMDSDVLAGTETLRGLAIFGSKVPYIIATFYAAFISRNKVYNLKVDDKEMRHERVTEFFYGNGGILGKKLHLGIDAEVTDGIANYTYLRNKSSAGRIKIIIDSIKNNKEKLAKETLIGTVKKFYAKRENGYSFKVNMDGEIVSATEFSAEIVQQGLKFVVPKEVTGNDR